MESQSINNALLAYKSHLESTEKLLKANQIYNQTKTAIVRHLIAGWDESLMPSSSRQLTNLEKERIQEFLEKTPVSKLSEALKVQEAVFEKYSVTPSSRNVYKSRLENLVDWVKKQGWIEAKTRPSSSRCNPKMRHGHGGMKKIRLTSRPTKLVNYSLNTHSSWNTQQVEKFIEEIDQFYDCLVDERYPGRLFNKVEPGTARNYVQHLYRIFGWLVNYKNIRPRQLSFNLLVPTDLKALDQNLKIMAFTEPEKKLIKHNNCWEEQIAQYVDIWICQLLKFLEEERKCNTRTFVGHLCAIHALVRYQYLGKTKEPKYKDIPVISVVNRHTSTCSKDIKNQEPISNLDMKWLDLDKVIQQIVEPLRFECEFRDVRHMLRPISTIAVSFIRFLAWGLLTYKPPRRQREFRELKTALYCQIEDKPKNLAPNQFIHPLPRNRNADKYHGYLYKDRNGSWYQHMTPESYKTGKTYGIQELLISNLELPGGQYFYDYLEAYLYGYWRDEKGNWMSAGNTTEAPSVGHKLYALRMALNPKDNHNFVFLGAQTKKPLSEENFCVLFKSHAHRLTGQLLTPHLLRDIYATWFLDREYTENQIRSLAYAMGHSVEELRRTYDKRKAQRKHEPIQEKLEETLNQLFGFNESETMTNDAPPEGIDSVLWAKLTPKLRTELRTELRTMYQKLKRT